MAVNDKPQITKQGQENQDTGQSGGLQLLTGVGQQNTPATRIWLGKATNAPGTRSLPHHHGEAETAFYVISGHLRMFGTATRPHRGTMAPSRPFRPTRTGVVLRPQVRGLDGPAPPPLRPLRATRERCRAINAPSASRSRPVQTPRHASRDAGTARPTAERRRAAPPMTACAGPCPSADRTGPPGSCRRPPWLPGRGGLPRPPGHRPAWPHARRPAGTCLPAETAAA